MSEITEMSPVDALRAAVVGLRHGWPRHVELGDLREPLAGWLDDTAADFEAERRTEPVTSSEEYALAVARVLLGVPDAAA